MIYTGSARGSKPPAKPFPVSVNQKPVGETTSPKLSCTRPLRHAVCGRKLPVQTSRLRSCVGVREFGRWASLLSSGGSFFARQVVRLGRSLVVLAAVDRALICRVVPSVSRSLLPPVATDVVGGWVRAHASCLRQAGMVPPSTPAL